MLELSARINAILSEILDIEANEDTNMQTCPQWTSLAHIDIIMSIEEEFGIAFGQEDLASLTSKAALVQKVQELL